jgi:hypothetical protein
MQNENLDLFNEHDHFSNLFNGMYTAHLLKDCKAFFKANKKKTKFFNLIRNQYNFNSIIDVSFIRNKQNFLQSNRERLDKMNDQDFLIFMGSDVLQKDFAMFVPDLIIDISGFAGVMRNELTRVRLNMNYNIYFYPEFLDFINEDIYELLQGTDIPYNENFFKVGNNNATNFISSMLAAYIYTYPDHYPELFKDCGYDAILHLLPMALTAYKKKPDVLGTDETIINYINYFLTNYCRFNEDILEYTAPYMVIKDI